MAVSRHVVGFHDYGLGSTARYGKSAGLGLFGFLIVEPWRNLAHWQVGKPFLDKLACLLERYVACH